MGLGPASIHSPFSQQALQDSGGIRLQKRLAEYGISRLPSGGVHQKCESTIAHLLFSHGVYWSQYIKPIP